MNYEWPAASATGAQPSALVPSPTPPEAAGSFPCGVDIWVVAAWFVTLGLFTCASKWVANDEA